MGYIEITLYCYILLINSIGFWVMGYDKRKAQKHQFRVKEKTLWKIAWIGGAIGLYVGMRKFRHKTKHQSFVIGLPLVSLFYIALVVTLIICLKM